MPKELTQETFVHPGVEGLHGEAMSVASVKGDVDFRRLRRPSP